MSAVRPLSQSAEEQSSRPNDGHRLDIQGLRAVAVLAVVAFHAGLPVPGGFVGVDIFFVISGYVITSMLYRELRRSGRVDLRRFYLRRAKRLTPALGVVVGLTVFASALILSPFEGQQVAAMTGLGAMLLSANWVIAETSGDYFGFTAESNPLLNTWSLSVEEQFYIFFPTILAIGWLLGRKTGAQRTALIGIVGLVGLASFAMIRGAFVFGADSWWAGFYSPLNRAWEFAAGALLALIFGFWAVRLSRPIATSLGIVGAALAGLSLVVINDETPFPGKWTILPVMASVLLIAGGSQHRTPVSWLLRRPTMVRIGDWSYSIYLWHWPLIVFAVVLWPQTAWAPMMAAALSLIPALASYHWVEQPIRSWPTVMPRRSLVTLGAFVVTPLLVAGSVWLAADLIWKPAFKTGVIAAKNVGTPISEEGYYPCQDEALATSADVWGPDVVRCFESRLGSAPSVVVLGDSHAWHLYPGLVDELSDENVMLYADFVDPVDPSYERIGEISRYLVESPDVRTVIIGNYWELRGISGAALDNFVGELKAHGKQVVIVDDVPDFPFDSFQCQYRKAPILPWTECDIARDSLGAVRTQQSRELGELVAAHPGVVLARAQDYICDERTCSMVLGSELLYADDHHLSQQGSRHVGRQLVQEPLVANALGLTK